MADIINNPETAVIGCIAVDKDAMNYAMAELKPEDFSRAEMKDAFSELSDVYSKNGKLDAADIYAMKNKDVIINCAAVVPAISAYKRFVNAVKSASVCRRAGTVGLSMATGSHTVDEMRGYLEKLSDIISRTGDEDLCVEMPAAAANFIRDQNDKADRYLKTGLKCLDENTAIASGDYMIIGGRPSSGKTALSIQMAISFAKHGKRVCYFSYETAPGKLFNRFMANAGDLPLYDIVRKKIDVDSEPVYMTEDYLSKLPITIIRSAGQSVQWIGSTAAMRKADVIFVDYAQLIPMRGKDRFETVTNISMALHTMAQRTGRLVVALSQLSRGTGKPTMDSLRESGQMEQDADFIILLAKGDNEEPYWFSVAKNKEGKTGDLPIEFFPQTQVFAEVAHDD